MGVSDEDLLIFHSTYFYIWIFSTGIQYFCDLKVLFFSEIGEERKFGATSP